MSPAPQTKWRLWSHSEIRLAVTAGLALGFTTATGLPFGYYAALAVLAAMGQTYGSSLELGRQRVLGTLLGAALLLLFCRGLAGIPMPLAIALALGLLRLLGGLLRLQVGYKVGGMVLVMGWLVHNTELTSWLPLRLGWTVFGILISLICLRLFWPSSAVQAAWQGWSELFWPLAEALDEPARPAAAIGQLRRRLMGQRAALVAIRDELGGAGTRHPMLKLLAEFDETSSRLISLLQVRPFSPAAAQLHAAEAALLAAFSERLRLWVTLLQPGGARGARGMPAAPPTPFVAPQTWRLLDQQLSSGQLLHVPLDLGGLKRDAARLQLCRQAVAAFERVELHWRQDQGILGTPA